MNGLVVVPLDQRSVLRIGGPERAGFLQNLVSGDVAKVAAGRAIWAALLTPQGKYLADFFLYPGSDAFLLDVEAKAAADLQRRLMLYRLRAKVTIEDVSASQRVFAVLGEAAGAAFGLPDEPGAVVARQGGIAAMDRACPPWASVASAPSPRSSTAAGPARSTTGIACASAWAFPIPAATWCPRRPRSWKPASMNWAASTSPRAATWARN